VFKILRGAEIGCSSSASPSGRHQHVARRARVEGPVGPRARVAKIRRRWRGYRAWEGLLPSRFPSLEPWPTKGRACARNSPTPRDSCLAPEPPEASIAGTPSRHRIGPRAARLVDQRHRPLVHGVALTRKSSSVRADHVHDGGCPMPRTSIWTGHRRKLLVGYGPAQI